MPPFLKLIVQSDLPAIASGRKQLDRLILELDTAKARLKTAREVLSSKILKSLSLVF